MRAFLVAGLVLLLADVAVAHPIEHDPEAGCKKKVALWPLNWGGIDPDPRHIDPSQPGNLLHVVKSIGREGGGNCMR
ncbi:MAG TPA: hypothetical protein VM681_08120 [Candidatus Thermoplasmatota archaeon]|nr:hypothetical protein [Candidatus Thermoplasmatota archaeon]